MQCMQHNQYLSIKAHLLAPNLCLMQVWKGKALRKAAAFFCCHTTAKAFQVGRRAAGGASVPVAAATQVPMPNQLTHSLLYPSSLA